MPSPLRLAVLGDPIEHSRSPAIHNAASVGQSLQAGANDLGGTLMEETISRMAGSEFGSAKSVEELVAIAAGIGRPARQRSTTYAPLAA